jgi:hypothetical protein
LDRTFVCNNLSKKEGRVRIWCGWFLRFVKEDVANAWSGLHRADPQSDTGPG